jgi:CMP-N-acetylneuraminic acid synthetase
MAKPTRRDYDAFNWLPLERWNVETILGPHLEQKVCCKICDEYILFKDASKHVASHVTQRKKQIADDRKRAKAARIEAMRLAREAKKEEKLVGI